MHELGAPGWVLPVRTGVIDCERWFLGFLKGTRVNGQPSPNDIAKAASSDGVGSNCHRSPCQRGTSAQYARGVDSRHLHGDDRRRQALRGFGSWAGSSDVGRQYGPGVAVVHRKKGPSGRAGVPNDVRVVGALGTDSVHSVVLAERLGAPHLPCGMNDKGRR
jgi:hypothetical protein